MLVGLASAVATAFGATAAQGQSFAGIGLAPRDATLAMRVDRRVDTSRWVTVALEAVEAWQAPIDATWQSADLVVARLAPDAVESIHVIGPGGRRWLHAVRWQDPVRLQHGLQRLGSRPMGGGRFQLPTQGLELVLLERWFILGPTNSPWLVEAADRARIESFDAADPETRGLVAGLEAAPIELVVKHAPPMGGATAIAVHPAGARTARIEIAGRYDASPLPIRQVGRLEADIVRRFDGRVACAVVEHGIGLVDPMMIQASGTHPAVIPAAALRSRFASRRVLVLDGEPVTIPTVGVIEVPAACVAVPVNDQDDLRPSEIDAMVDEWMTTAGRSFRRGWTNQEAVVTRTRTDDIRHLSLEPGLLEASGGHPMALGASLNWTVHAGEAGGTWLVAGTAPGLVRRVIASLDEVRTDGDPEPLGMAGIASPARLAIQFAALAELRRRGDDDRAADDASTLTTAARILGGVERVSWKTTLQDDHRVRATAEVRLSTGETPIDRPLGPGGR